MNWSDTLGLAKGGKNNLATEGFNLRSNPKDVEEALKDAIKNKHAKRIISLRALLKVIKRGGSMSLLPIDPSGVLRESCALGNLQSCNVLCTFFPEECEDTLGCL